MCNGNDGGFSQDLVISSLQAVYADKRVGERFEFGHYPQGENGEIRSITWRVLRRDFDGLLVISELGLDVRSYNEDHESRSWADCTLRKWLNGEFLANAFNDQERFLIKVSDLRNNVGRRTKDRIFLLSICEARSLFTNDKERECKVTDFVVENDGYVSDLGEYEGNTLWLLRSRNRKEPFSVACVCTFGNICSCDFINDKHSVVRPALKLVI